MWDLEDGCYPTCSELGGSLTYRMFDDCLSRINAYFRRWRVSVISHERSYRNLRGKSYAFPCGLREGRSRDEPL